MIFPRPWVMAVTNAAAVFGLSALPQAQRRAPSSFFLFLPLLLMAFSWPHAVDHQRAVELGMLLPLALAGWTWGGSLRPGVPFWRFAAALAAAASAVALAQACGGLKAAARAVDLLPPALREVGAARLATSRAFGTLPIPGHFAALQAMTVPFLLFWLAESPGRRRWVPVGLLALSLAGCLVTRSLLGTGLWLLAASLTLFRSLAWRMARPVAGAGLTVFAVVLLLRQDLGQLEPLALRVMDWRVALWAFAQSPWLGVGPGGIGLAGLSSPWGEHNITPFAHNTPLQLLAEFGLVGFPFFLGLFASALGLALRLWRGDRPASVALVVLLCHNLFDFSFYEPALLFFFCFLAGSHSSMALRPGRLFYPVLSLLLGTAAVLAALQARAEGLAQDARIGPREERAERLMRASSLAPWRLTELLEAAGAAVEVGEAGVAGKLEEMLDRRAWIAPRSASWAQAKAMLSLLQGRRAEAWAWAREAARRAPFRQDLAELERRCRP